MYSVELGTVFSPTKNKPYLLRSFKYKEHIFDYSFERKMLEYYPVGSLGVVTVYVIPFFFFFWLHHEACGILFPWPGPSPGPWQVKHRALTAGLWGNSLFMLCFYCYTLTQLRFSDVCLLVDCAITYSDQAFIISTNFSEWLYYSTGCYLLLPSKLPKILVA